MVLDGVAHLANISTCGSVHSCPVCSPKIRAARADEIELGLTAWFAQGHHAYFLTTTTRHTKGDRLAPMLDTIANAFRACHQGRAWVGTDRYAHGCNGLCGRTQAHRCPQRVWTHYDGLRDRLSIAGMIRALEVTYGRNGWHPHLHTLILTERALTDDELAELVAHYEHEWGRRLAAAGYGTLKRGVGVQLERVRSAADIAGYVSKFVDELGQARAVGNELTRHDLKAGRRKGRTPYQLLHDARLDGDADALDLWREYEQASHGHQVLTWSGGLKARLAIVEVTDEELAAEKIGGEPVAMLSGADHTRVERTRYAHAELLTRAELYGGIGVEHFLVQLRAGTWRPGQRRPPPP